MNHRPLFIVDDDVEERDIIKEIFQDLNVPNPVLFFDTGYEVLEHLKNDPTNPFLIICDVNLPLMDGFTLRQRFADENSLHYKSIPFIFWSTTASNDQIKKAYDYGAHGFFFKGNSYAEIKQSLSTIISYWMTSKSPVV